MSRKLRVESSVERSLQKEIRGSVYPKCNNMYEYHGSGKGNVVNQTLINHYQTKYRQRDDLS